MEKPRAGDEIPAREHDDKKVPRLVIAETWDKLRDWCENGVAVEREKI